MEKFRNYISVILKGVHISKIRRKELEEEICDHLEMLKKELIEEGYSEEQAELEAIERFGEIEDIRNGLKKVFTPYNRFKEIINQKSFLRESLQWTGSICGALIISLSIRSYVFAAAEVHQCSMQNTLYEGQRLIENKIQYCYSEPKRGDIVIINEESEKGVFNVFAANTEEFIGKFYNKEENEKNRLIKRIIGVPGDEVDIKDGKVYLNGQVCNEPYVNGDTYPKNMKFPIIIPEKEYFVLGDNRENSMDSRDIGLVSIDKIEGKAVLRLWPIDKFGSISGYPTGKEN